jgi:hypothetical protein
MHTRQPAPSSLVPANTYVRMEIVFIDRYQLPRDWKQTKTNAIKYLETHKDAYAPFVFADFSNFVSFIRQDGTLADHIIIAVHCARNELSLAIVEDDGRVILVGNGCPSLVLRRFTPRKIFADPTLPADHYRNIPHPSDLFLNVIRFMYDNVITSMHIYEAHRLATEYAQKQVISNPPACGVPSLQKMC